MKYFIITKRLAWELHTSGKEVFYKTEDGHEGVKNVSDLCKGTLYVRPSREHLRRVQKLLYKQTIIDNLLSFVGFLGILFFGVVFMAHVIPATEANRPNLYIGIAFGIVGAFSINWHTHNASHSGPFSRELVRIHNEEIKKTLSRK